MWPGLRLSLQGPCPRPGQETEWWHTCGQVACPLGPPWPSADAFFLPLPGRPELPGLPCSELGPRTPALHVDLHLLISGSSGTRPAWPQRPPGRSGATREGSWGSQPITSQATTPSFPSPFAKSIFLTPVPGTTVISKTILVRAPGPAPTTPARLCTSVCVCVCDRELHWATRTGACACACVWSGGQDGFPCRLYPGVFFSCHFVKISHFNIKNTAF